MKHLLILALLPLIGGCAAVAGEGFIGGSLLSDTEAFVTRPDGTTIGYRRATQADFARAVVGEAVKAGVSAAAK